MFIKKLNKRKLNLRFCLGIHRFFTIYIFCHIFFGQDRRELPRAALNLAKQLYTLFDEYMAVFPICSTGFKHKNLPLCILETAFRNSLGLREALAVTIQGHFIIECYCQSLYKQTLQGPPTGS